MFLISLKAGGTGLNLTGASVVIHADPWWNAAAQDQATDRAHRIGQTHVVSVERVIAKGTIEERILALQEAKSDLADQVVGASGVSLASLSRDDLVDLLLIGKGGDVNADLHVDTLLPDGGLKVLSPQVADGHCTSAKLLYGIIGQCVYGVIVIQLSEAKGNLTLLF